MEKKMVLPGWFIKNQEASMFLDYKDKYPEEFFEDRIIDSFYDCPGDLLWNGGRIITPPHYFDNDLFDSMNIFYRRGIKLRYTFTNLYIHGDMVKDYYCNHFIKRHTKPTDAFIVSSPDLFNYLKETYPEYMLIYSTTLNITDIDKVNEMTKDYIYVMNYNFNNNDEYISKLKYLHNIEILCGEPCVPNCPHRLEHYQYLSKLHVRMMTPNFDCPYGHEMPPFYEVQKSKNAISNDRLNELSDKGVIYFKISGRATNPMQYFQVLIYYLVKPEFQEKARDILQTTYYTYNRI